MQPEVLFNVLIPDWEVSHKSGENVKWKIILIYLPFKHWYIILYLVDKKREGNLFNSFLRKQ